MRLRWLEGGPQVAEPLGAGGDLRRWVPQVEGFQCLFLCSYICLRTVASKVVMRARAHLALLWCWVDVLFGSTDILVERLHCILCGAVLADLSPNAPAYAVLDRGDPSALLRAAPVWRACVANKLRAGSAVCITE